MRKVKYIGASDEQVRWGNNDDPRGLLNEGELYTVEREEVHSYHTKYHLKEFPGKRFNSVCFDPDRVFMDIGGGKVYG
ncbi:MAG: hypothetical protein H6Q72_1437 [Firmicutes bacterium]|nr:hypothetical protein [Bacillota bacterium]